MALFVPYSIIFREAVTANEQDLMIFQSQFEELVITKDNASNRLDHWGRLISDTGKKN